MTICGWLRNTAIGATGTTHFFLGDASASDSYIVGRNEADGSLRLSRRGGGSDVHSNTTNNMSAGAWHHACFRLTANDDAECVLDADFGNKASSSTSVTPSGIDRISFGKRDNTSDDQFFAGQVECWAIWSVALNDAEITHLAAGAHPLSIRPASLAHLWDNMGRGSTVIDHIGDAVLAITGTSQSSQSPAGLTHWTWDVGRPPVAFATAPTEKFLQIRASNGDAYESGALISVPATGLVSLFFEVTNSTLRLALPDGTDESVTPSGSLNTQSGDLIVGSGIAAGAVVGNSGNGWLSDLILLPNSSGKPEMDAILAARLAPTVIQSQADAFTGQANVIDLADFVDDKRQGLVFSNLAWGLDTTEASLSGSSLTISSDVETQDIVTATVINQADIPTQTTLSLTVNFAPAENAFSNGWGFRRTLLVPAQATIPETVTGFVLLVSLGADNDLRTTANGGNVESSLGFDVRFETTTGARLAHELEAYSPTTGALTAWVRIPSWDFSVPLSLHLYYGRSGLAVSQARPADTWADEVIVADCLTGTNRVDNSAVLVPTAVSFGSLIDTAGTFGGSSVMTGTTDPFGGLSAFTVRLFHKAAAGSIDSNHGLFSIGEITGQDAAQTVVIRLDDDGFSGGGTNVILFSVNTAGGVLRLESANLSQTTNEQFVGARYDSANGLALFLGQEKTTPTFLASANNTAVVSLDGDMYVGAASKDTIAGGYNGIIDQLMIRDDALSDRWLLIEAAMMHNRGAFVGVSTEDAPGEQQSPVAAPIQAGTTTDVAIDIDVIGSSLDPDGDALSISAIGTPSNGTAIESGSGSGIITYTPGALFAGSDSFTYTVTDGTKTSTATVSVEVMTDSEDPTDIDYGVYLTPDLPASPTFINVSNQFDLKDAIDGASAGDVITVADGVVLDFSAGVDLAANGTAANPIILRAASPLGASINNDVRIKGDYWRLVRFDVTGGHHVQVQSTAANTQIAGVRVRDRTTGSYGGSASFAFELDNAINAVVACCEVKNWKGAGLRCNTGCTNLIIGEIWLHDQPNVTPGNASEALLIGEGQKNRTAMNALVDKCLIQNWNLDDEVVSSKGRDIIFRRINVHNSEGRASARIGIETTWEACDFTGCATGMMLFDGLHIAKGCKFPTTSKRGLRIAPGDYTPTNIFADIDKNDFSPAVLPHPAAQQCQVHGCEGRIDVGEGFAGDDEPALQTKIRQHTGLVVQVPGLQKSTDSQPTTASELSWVSRITLVPGINVGPR